MVLFVAFFNLDDILVELKNIPIILSEDAHIKYHENKPKLKM